VPSQLLYCFREKTTSKKESDSGISRNITRRHGLGSELRSSAMETTSTPGGVRRTQVGLSQWRDVEDRKLRCGQVATL
jgi:hypothetical protein